MEKQQDKNENQSLCNWCNQPATIIWVHGHGQCSKCGINVDECCRGEQSDLPSLAEKIISKISPGSSSDK